MIILNKTIVVQRGESFTLGILISKEHSGFEFPYWTEAGIQNPYYLLQIRNSEFYEKDKGFIYNYFIPCDILMDKSKENSFNLLQCHGSPLYVSGPDDSNVKSGDFYYKMDNMNLSFYVKTGNSYLQLSNLKQQWTMLKQTLLPLDLAKFRQGTWWYDIRLISGTKTVDYLRGKYESLFYDRAIDGKFIGMDKYAKQEYDMYGRSSKWLYDKICAIDTRFKDSISWDRPLVNYQTVDRIAYPEKFIVR